jgi:hypothetical protein
MRLEARLVCVGSELRVRGDSFMHVIRVVRTIFSTPRAAPSRVAAFNQV